MSSTVLAMIIAVSNAIVAVFTYILAVHKSNNDKDKELANKQDKANAQLKEACDNGSLSDLIDATKKIGESKR